MTNWTPPDLGPVTPIPFKKLRGKIWYLNYMYLKTYFAKEIAKGIWQTCSYEDIATPDYEPHFIVAGNGDGFAVYNKESIPIICTNREIFKHNNFKIDNAIWTNKKKIFNVNPIPKHPIDLKPGTLFDHNGRRINSGGRAAK